MLNVFLLVNEKTMIDKFITAPQNNCRELMYKTLEFVHTDIICVM